MYFKQGRKLLWSKSACTQSSQDRFLLAQHESRLDNTSQELWQVPALCQYYSTTSWRPKCNIFTLALLTIKEGVRFAVVAVDYFTKWVEMEALVNITAKVVEQFLWKNVICWHGIPHVFITDNSKQFDYDSFWEWCAKLDVRNYYLSLGHPRQMDR